MASQLRFVVVVHSAKDITSVQPLSQLHLKVKYCQTSLRTRSHKLTQRRINFNETFAFGKKEGAGADRVEIQLRVDSIMSKSTRVGIATIPLRAVVHGQKIDGDYAFDPKGGFVHVSIEADASSPLVFSNIEQLNEVDSDNEDSIVAPVGNLLKSIAGRSGGTSKKQTSPPSSPAVAGAGKFGAAAVAIAERGDGGIVRNDEGQRVYVPKAALPSSAMGSSAAVAGPLASPTEQRSQQPAQRGAAAAPLFLSAPRAVENKAKLVTEGTQTDLPQITREEVEALYNFAVPSLSASAEAASTSLADSANATKKHQRGGSGAGRGGRSAPALPQFRPVLPAGLRDSDPSTPMLSSAADDVAFDGFGNGGRTTREVVREASRNPNLLALRATSVGWPTDEIESLLIYTKQLERERDEAERKLAAFHIARGRHASQALAAVASRNQIDPQPPQWVRDVVQRHGEASGGTLTQADITHIYANYDAL